VTDRKQCTLKASPQCAYRKAFRAVRDAYQGMRMMYKAAFEVGLEQAEEIQSLQAKLSRVKGLLEESQDNHAVHHGSEE